MGYHVEERSFQPSVSFITTDTKREDPPRIPMIGAHAGCLFGRSPGASVRALEAELRDLHGARTARAKAQLVIAKRVSASGVLRSRRLIT